MTDIDNKRSIPLPTVTLPGYHITETLFSSPTTRVFRAEKLDDHQIVVLRTCGETTATPAQYARLAFTYQLLQRFDHRNIAKAVAWLDDRQWPCLVMEDIQGINLWQYAALFENKQLPLLTFLDMAVQLAEALDHIHREQVIHKDLHPGNMVVNRDSLQVQVIDFGLASLLSREQPSVDMPENIEGLLSYISPEQSGRMNRAMDYRSDFYSLGVTFYELLAGKRPFEANDALGLVYAHIAVQQAPLHKVRHDVPTMLSALIDKLLSKNAEDRYQSAFGLKQDLLRCRAALSSEGDAVEFTLGSDDLTDRFQIPQVLYGRTAEKQILMQNFYRACAAQPQLLAVGGYSGIGKSALVHEVHKPIAAQSGLFLSGKFDQFQSHSPYSALKRALSVWTHQMLRLPEAQLKAERQRLLAELGDNARVLCDFMDEFGRVLGELPELPALGPIESQTRFHLVFQRFMKSVTARQPWVLFLDDVQWADYGTLALIQEILSEPDVRLLVVVAYRDNEVNATHPAMQMLQRVQMSMQARDQSQAMDRISLGPLPVDDVQHLLADTLHCTQGTAGPLAARVHAKAGGNPFFTLEFVKTLYSRGLLDFDADRRCWQWDLQAIDAESITDNVVELMLGNMRTLPDDTQSLLQMAACIGGRFDLQTLAVVTEQAMADCARTLWPALQSGLLVQDGGDWLLGMMSQSPLLAPKSAPLAEMACWSSVVPKCKFVHDRMLQAAYESMSTAQRTASHLHIGRLLSRCCDADARQVTLFDIVEQFNLGEAGITDSQERLQLADWNAQAATQARQASVWAATARFADMGLRQLRQMKDGADIWQHYDLCHRLHTLAAEAHYLQGNVEQADRLYDALICESRSELDKAEICARRVVQYIGRADYHNALAMGHKGLAFLQVTVPETDANLTEWVNTQGQQLSDYFSSRPIEQLYNLPEMEDRRSQTALYILMNVAVTAMLLTRFSFFKWGAQQCLLLSIEQGRSDLLPMVLALHGIVQNWQGHYEQAFKAGQTAIQIKQDYPHCREAASAMNGIAYGCAQLGMAPKPVLALYQQGYEEGLHNGELARAGVCLSGMHNVLLTSGHSMQESLEHAEHCLQFGKKNSLLLFASLISKPFVQSMLTGHYQLGEESFEIAHYRLIQHSFFQGFLALSRAHYAFWNEVALAPKDCPFFQALDSYHQQQHSTFTFDFYVMACLSVIRAKQSGAWNTLSVEQQKKWEESDAFFFDRLEKLAAFYPPNHQHKIAILQAQQLAAAGAAFTDVARKYQEAIECATANGFRQYAALANEYYGDYLVAEGFTDLAEGPVRKAYQIYRAWGCQPKLNRLPERYPFLQSLVSLESSAIKGESHRSMASDSQSRVSTLDYASVVKASQMMSDELDLSKLLGRIMDLIMENAGAQFAALVLTPPGQNDEEPRVEALVDAVGQHRDILHHGPLSQCEALPTSLIHFTLRSGEVVNLADARCDATYGSLRYIEQKQPKSVLSLPVPYRDRLIGVLYLENNLTASAFTEARLEAVRSLLAQAAISLENARLFNEISELNASLEAKVDARTRALAQANEEMKSFSYTVSHDLRAPLRNIKGYSAILLDEHAANLNPEAQRLLQRMSSGAEKMSELINGLLDLSRLQNRDMKRQLVDLSDVALDIVSNLQEQEPNRAVRVEVEDQLQVYADPGMIRSVMENLLGNAWKYSGKNAEAHIRVYRQIQSGRPVVCVQDNGAGFDMKHVGILFGTFQRLHTDKEFPGTGIGLATVKRVIQRHGGEIWGHGEVGQGATFCFALPSPQEG